MTTIGAYTGATTVWFFPLNDFANDPGIPAGTYLPWLGGFDEFWNVFPFGSGRPRGYALQAITCFATASTLTPSDTDYHPFTFGAAFQTKPGDMYVQPTDSGNDLRFSFAGVMSTPSANAGTIEFQLLLDDVIVADTGAITLATSQSNVPWEIDVDCQVVGVGGSPLTCTLQQLRAHMAIGAAATNPGVFQLLPLVGGGDSYDIDNLANHPIVLQVKFSETTSGLSIACQLGKYELQLATTNAVG